MEKLNGENKLEPIEDIDAIFKDAYTKMKQTDLFLFGIYPVHNPFFMKPIVSTKLKFIIGVLYGYINRHHKNLIVSPKSETKEDYELSILFYKMDGGVLRYNNITVKTKFNAQGGLGVDRFERNKTSAEYLQTTYPDIVSIFHRKTKNKKTNGMTEIRLREQKEQKKLYSANIK